jgi:hypothetical protein
VIVSHLNANTKEGLDWLEEIVVKGLRACGGKEVSWEIEVHGSSSEDEAAFEDPVNANPGPAVYIIHKKPLMEFSNEGEESTVPLKFFGY